MTTQIPAWADNDEITGALLYEIQKRLLIPEVLLRNFINLAELPADIKEKAKDILMKLQSGHLTQKGIADFGSLLHTHRHPPTTFHRIQF